MRKFLAALMAAGLLLGGASFAQAAKPENPGEKGHCTAIFNGKKKGHGDDSANYPGPFSALQGRAPDGLDDEDGDGDPSDEDEVGGQITDLYEYCENTYGVGGNPAHGRWTCVVGQANDPETEDNEYEPTECEEN